MAEDFQGLDRLAKRLARLATDTRRVERPLRAAGALAVSSIEENFQEQGRPQRWIFLQPATLKRRRKGRGAGSPKVLIDTGRLKNSIAYQLATGPAVEVGTNVIYAARHHFGYPGGTGRGKAKTPARAFLVLQPNDVKDIGQIFKRHIARVDRSSS